MTSLLPDALSRRPHIRLSGPVNDAMLQKFLEQLDEALGTGGPIVLELTTSGGEADIGRRIAEDISIQTERRFLSKDG